MEINVFVRIFNAKGLAKVPSVNFLRSYIRR